MHAPLSTLQWHVYLNLIDVFQHPLGKNTVKAYHVYYDDDWAPVRVYILWWWWCDNDGGKIKCCPLTEKRMKSIFSVCNRTKIKKLEQQLCRKKNYYSQDDFIWWSPGEVVILVMTKVLHFDNKGLKYV